MNIRFLSAALAVAFAFPLTAWGQYGVTSSFILPPAGPPVSMPPPAVVPVVPAVAPPATTTLPPQYARAHKRFSFDLRGFYGFRAAPHSTYATDMAGLEAEFAWYFTPRQALTFGASFGSGGNDAVNFADTPYGSIPVSEDFTRSDISLMAGYRFTQPLTKRTTLSFGIKAGLDIQELSYDYYWGRCHNHYWGCDCCCDDSYSETACGFAYAASVTLETRLSEHIMLQLGYQYRGATTKPDAPSIVPGEPSVSADTLRWHEVHLGLRFVF